MNVTDELLRRMSSPNLRGEHSPGDLLTKYGCRHDQIERFLLWNPSSRGRQRLATDIVESVLAPHGKPDARRWLAELARVEHGIRELQPRQRDHAVHAVLSFLLGTVINEEFMAPQSQVDVFEWKLAGLLHDVAYPLQIAWGLVRSYKDKINEFGKGLQIDPGDVRFRLVADRLDSLAGGQNGLDIIQQRLNDWRLDIDARSEYREMQCHGEACHGMLSALSILYLLDLMYQSRNPERKHRPVRSPDGVDWNEDFFAGAVVSACTAIFVQSLRSSCFRNRRIDRSRAPTAFLLVLSDSLQDWDRPSLKCKKGYPATLYAMEISEGTLRFHAPPNRKREIEDQVLGRLVAPDVEID